MVQFGCVFFVEDEVVKDQDNGRKYDHGDNRAYEAQEQNVSNILEEIPSLEGVPRCEDDGRQYEVKESLFRELDCDASYLCS